MPASPVPPAFCLAILVLSVATVVHAPAGRRAQAQEAAAGGSRSIAAPAGARAAQEALPEPVADMREAILEAVRSGTLESLRTAIELNELRPVIGDGSGVDPIAALAAASADGSGRDVLEALGRILDGGWTAVPQGQDIENNRIFVWPRFAETGVVGLAPDAEAELARMLPADELARTRATGRYAYWRLGIGADGTWHYLRR
ncbi:MAG: hypothetical protein AB7O57_18415 [Hyphomicrobiaceae bacterium]